MIIAIWEGRYPEPVDMKQVEGWIKNVGKPALSKAGYKALRFGWMSIGVPMNLGILTGELDSLADIDRASATKELQEAAEEFGRRFPGTEMTRRILEVVE